MARKMNGLAYPEEDQFAGLELAASHGQKAASRILGVSPTTIRAWIERHPQRWSDLKAGDREVQRLGTAQRLEDLAEGYMSVEAQAIDRAETLIKSSDAKETAALIKAMGSSRGLANVNARSARGEDADKVEVNINFPQIEQAMERILNSAAPAPQLPTPIDSEAEEV